MASLSPPSSGIGIFQDLEPPALQVGIALIHAEKLRRRKAPPRRRRPPGEFPGWPSAHRLHLSAARRGGSRFPIAGFVCERFAFRFRHLAHFGVGKHGLGFGDPALGLPQLADERDDRFDLRKLHETRGRIPHRPHPRITGRATHPRAKEYGRAFRRDSSQRVHHAVERHFALRARREIPQLHNTARNLIRAQNDGGARPDSVARVPAGA